MRRGSISKRIAPLIIFSCEKIMLCGINLPFGRLSPSLRQVTHVLLTRPPLIRSRRNFIARLACVRHAASVRPEPGSNSQFKSLICYSLLKVIDWHFIYLNFCLIFKDQVFFTISRQLIHYINFKLFCQHFFLVDIIFF